MDPVPADVQQFIARHIDSVAQLEALLLLFRSPEVSWEANEIARRLYLGGDETKRRLDRLVLDGLLVSANDRYALNAASSDNLESIARLADAYSRYLVPVTRLIHERDSGISRFADAFKFRKDK